VHWSITLRRSFFRNEVDQQMTFKPTIAPSATTLDHMNDAGDHPTISQPLFAAHILGQRRLNAIVHRSA
jgi:hypothetical protein